MIERLVRSAGVALVAAAVTGAVASAGTRLADAELEPVTFANLRNWAQDDHEAAFAAFRRSCAAIVADSPELRNAKPPSLELTAVCRTALESGEPSGGARAFFERSFSAFLVRTRSGTGLLTGYFEPEYEGSRRRGTVFSAPLLTRPDDLITREPGQVFPGLDPALQAARRTEIGLKPYPDRAAIEEGALGERAQPIVYMRPGEAFITHVQGSARIRLAEGGTLRVAYAGRNGQPYSSIGRVIVERGHVPLGELSLERMLGWLARNPLEAREVMRTNRSYIFFREAPELDPKDGPIGGAGFPLVPGRSLAVDRNLWSYGLPFWLEGEIPAGPGRTEPLRRLMVAQDTGSAILGPARGDFFFGTGAEAGTLAGLTRYQTRFVVLLPKGVGAP